MTAITIDVFNDYFQQLHDGYEPYPWQRRLAELAVRGDWPGAIDLPTGSGKTACLDVAVFALAAQACQPPAERTAPRRIFFCVNRRVIVGEAYQRARRIAKTIWEAEKNNDPDKPVLRRVAAALRTVAGTNPNEGVPPLDVLEVRGGIYRDSRWARSITQPTIVCTTLDQLGSRLLFRGYGVSSNAAPIHAALIAYDSLVLLDEAHISEPFRQTLDHVQRYLDPQKWAKQSVGVRPVTVVPMTATPNNEMVTRGVIQLEDDDRQVDSLNRRLIASKHAELRNAKDVAKKAIEAAIELTQESPAAVGIIVNRIATARAIYDQLSELQAETSNKKRKVPSDATIELVIGSMRPIDRDQQAERLRTLVGSDRPETTEKPSFTIATQCLEVGADYDFDILITECASLDALRQRFGRLNRAGRKVKAKAVILVENKSVKPESKLDNDKPLDPIYGNALARTWNWLQACVNDDTVDFRIDAFDALLKEHGDNGRPPQNLLAPSASLNAPVMLPAYLDLWCQTAPHPAPDPDASLFIHGPEAGEPDVQVCWRADLIEDDHMTRDQWCDIVALLPPTAAECICLPISRVRRWMGDQVDRSQNYGDVLGGGHFDESDTTQNNKHGHQAVLWRGTRNSKLLHSQDELQPGDTLVLPASDYDSRVLGHLPEAGATLIGTITTDESPAVAINDVAELAFTRARDLAALRLHPAIRPLLPADRAFDDLLAAAGEKDQPPTRAEWSYMLQSARDATPDDHDRLKQTLCHLWNKGFRIEPYPDQRGVVLISRKRLGSTTEWFMPATDDGEDESSRIERDKPVLLGDHTEHVIQAVLANTERLQLDVDRQLFHLAAQLHDLGKADERFQAMLRGTDRTDTWLLTGASPPRLAKSAGIPRSRVEQRQARQRAGLPDGFRHEMLSVQIAAIADDLPDDPSDRELILHLIAAHHGHARPFAPVVNDEELPDVDVHGITLHHEQRAACPPHRLDSGIAERFWRLTRRFGWWGLAYLEAALRLADQQASANEDAGQYDHEHHEHPAEATV